ADLLDLERVRAPIDQSAWKASKLVSIGLVALIPIFCAVLVVQASPVPTVTGETADQFMKENTNTVPSITPERDTVQEALRTVEGFLLADGWGNKSEWVRERWRVLPLMKDYYATRDGGPVPFSELRCQAVRETPSGLMTFVEAAIPDQSPLLFSIEHDEEGAAVEWESHVCYSADDLEEFLDEKRPTAHLFRVVATLSKEANQDPDLPHWVVHLEVPQTGTVTAALLKKGSEACRRMVDAFQMARVSQLPVMVHLAFLPDEEQPLILESEQIGWRLEAPTRELKGTALLQAEALKKKLESRSSG
ncbi:MAG: hypothetical protein AAF514_02605, partial [Verrucomicrobiota bacterium]